MSGAQNDMKYLLLDVTQPIITIIPCLSINIRGSLTFKGRRTLQAWHWPLSDFTFYDNDNPV